MRANDDMKLIEDMTQVDKLALMIRIAEIIEESKKPGFKLSNEAILISPAPVPKFAPMFTRDGMSFPLVNYNSSGSGTPDEEQNQSRRSLKKL